MAEPGHADRAFADAARKRRVNVAPVSQDPSAIIRLQRVAGNRAVATLLQPPRSGAGAPGPPAAVQRLVTLKYPGASTTGASVPKLESYLGLVDKVVAGSARKVQLGPVRAGASMLADVQHLTKTYSFLGPDSGPEADRLITDSTLWSGFTTAPDHFRTFLYRVWASVRGVASGAMCGHIYDMYGGQTPGHFAKTTPADKDYLNNRLAPWLALSAVGAWQFWNQDDAFLHAESPDWASGGASQRFYLNPGPDHGALYGAFERLLRTFVGKYRGKGKVASPSQYSKRADAIVLWIPTASAALAEAELRGMDPRTLGADRGGSVPEMLRAVSAGNRSIGTAEEPSGAGARGQSFGSVRAGLLAEALDGSADIEAFLTRAKAEFAQAGIPWNAPDSGGNVTGHTAAVLARRPLN